MAHHNLKLRKQFFDDVESGRKTFELRFRDRPYAVGDTVQFAEIIWIPDEIGSDGDAWPTGRVSRVFRITYTLPGGDYGLDDHFIALSIEPAKATDEEANSAVFDAIRVVAESWSAPVAEATGETETDAAYVERRVDELDALRLQLTEAMHAVGEAWFAGGATLAEAITRKCRALEGLGDVPKRESEDFFADDCMVDEHGVARPEPWFFDPEDADITLVGNRQLMSLLLDKHVREELAERARAELRRRWARPSAEG